MALDFPNSPADGQIFSNATGTRAWQWSAAKTTWKALPATSSLFTTVCANSASWGAGGDPYDDTALQAASGNWDSTYTTVSSNSATWGIDTVYDDSALQAASGNWDSTYTTVSANSAIWGGAGSGDFCSTTVLLNEVSACGGEMSIDGTLSASDMITTTLTADGIYLNTGANRAPELGELVWDDEERTLDLGLDNGVVLQIGEEQIINVKAAENILNGQVVYASGAVGGASGKVEVSLYSASSAEGVDPGATDELFFVGIATQDIALNGFGYITTFGKVRDIHVEQGGVIDRNIVGPENTDVSSSNPGWDLGTVLYISTSAGRLTNTKPVSPNKIIPSAMVVGVNGNQRTLFTRYEHGYHIDELHDVRVISPQQNDVLAYNSTLESWDNITSNNWESTFTTVSTNSADWVTYSSTSIYPEASWVIDEDTFISNLSSKVPTQQSVKFYVDNIVTGINNLKGGYDAGTDTPQLDTLPTVTVLQGDSYYVTASGNFFTTAVDPGDLIIATIDNATLSSDWVIVNRNIQDELIDRWNGTYTVVGANSASWSSTYTTVSANSASWGIDTIYDDSALQAASGNWNNAYTTVSVESANWDSTYTTVSANSASWGIDTIYDDSALQAASGNWDSTYTTVLNESASWIGGDYDDSALQAASGNWDSTYTTVSSNSAAWGIDTIYDDSALQAASGNWDSTYTTVSSNSAAWGIDTIYDDSALQAASGNWDSTYTTVLAESATWSDTSTVVQNNSGIWDNSAAIAYNDGATNSIEIGLLDSTTETGNYAITIQGSRGAASQVAAGVNSIAIGTNAEAGTATKGNSVAIGTSCKATGASSLAIGHDSGGGAQATIDQAVAIGPGCEAGTEFGAIAIGNVSRSSGNYGAAIGVGCVVGSNTSRSNAFGYNVNVNATGVSEFGRWRTSADRKGAVRCSGQSGTEGNIDAMVCITTLNSSTAKQDGGTTVGSEAAGTIPRGMHTIRQWGNDFYLDANDASGNITTVQLGGGGGNVVETVTSNTYTQPTTTTHTIYNDDDVSVTQDIVATLMSPADHTGTTVHKKIGSSHNVVITPPSGTIDGAASFTLQFENESVSIFSDGTNFFIA